MGDDERGIDVAVLDVLKQTRKVLVHVGLPHLQRQPLVEGSAHRHLVDESPVDAGNRHRSALAAAVNCLAERAGPVGGHERHRLGLVVPVIEMGAMRLESDRVDA